MTQFKAKDIILLILTSSMSVGCRVDANSGTAVSSAAQNVENKASGPTFASRWKHGKDGFKGAAYGCFYLKSSPGEDDVQPLSANYLDFGGFQYSLLYTLMPIFRERLDDLISSTTVLGLSTGAIPLKDWTKLHFGAKSIPAELYPVLNATLHDAQVRKDLKKTPTKVLTENDPMKIETPLDEKSYKAIQETKKILNLNNMRETSPQLLKQMEVTTLDACPVWKK